MEGPQKLVLALLIFAGLGTTAPVFATYKCDPGSGGKCHCAGSSDCKELDKSGMCGNNSILCHSSDLPTVDYTCDCNAKVGIDKNSLKLKQPLSKSQ
jgi:hypothetical protein